MTETPAPVDLQLEVVVIPVADVDRAKAFYTGLGWRLDADFPFDNGFRVVQLTPPGSPCSVQFGTDITSTQPGTAEGLYLIVSDIQAARDQLVARGAEVSEIFHPESPGAQFRADGGGRLPGPADEHASYSTFATFGDPDGNRWLIQEVTTRLPGRVEAHTSFASIDLLAQALRRAAAAHGEHEARDGGKFDENWPDWYAAYMVAEQAGTELPHVTNSGLPDAVRVEVERYVDRNPRSAARHERAAKSMPGGNTRSILHFEPFPLAFARGEDAHLWSLDGDRYVDFLGEFTAGLYGHSQPAILDAVRDALAGGLSFGGVNGLEPRLAELICARFPSVDLVRFTNSGTEANLMALALAVATTGRRKVLVFRGGYHGGVLTFGEAPSPVTVPHEWVLADYDDVAGTRDLIRAHRHDLAAVLVEPMLGAGGCVPASQEFLEMLRAESTTAGAVLVFDEVMTSRLAPGGLQSVVGVTPDLTTLGKYLGGGLSFGAFGGRADLMAAYDPTRPGALFHAGTFNNNVLTLSAGIAGLEQVLDDATLTAVNDRGDRLRLALDDLARPAGLHVSGRGSMMTIHPAPAPVLASAPLTDAQAAVKELVFFALVNRGFWLARRGMLTVSIPITDTMVDELLAAFGELLETYAEAVANSA